MAKQTEIAYESKEWQPYNTGGTIVRSVDLNRMEQGISDACAAVDELRTKRLPTYLVAQDGDTATQDLYLETILGPCLILDLAERATYYDNGEDGEGHERTKLTSGADIDDLRDSLSQYVRPTRRVTNPLLVSKTPSDPSNQVSAVVADSGALSGYVNLPPAWSAGPVFALRIVSWLSDNHCVVWLFEGYPKRRVWANFYNIGAWSGWEQV